MNAPIRRTMLLSSVFAAFLYIGTDGALAIAHLHINFSSSVPLGLYRETPELPGSYAGICLPTNTLTQAAHAGLAIDSGTCPGGVEPILKPVFVATPAHPIAFGQDGFSLDGKLLPNTAPKPRSKTGVPLAHVPFGLYETGLWAISDFSPSSFDSRYFGPVEPGSILFHAQPFLTF
ncbi:MAG: hypothetical protein M3Y72_17935 [Acidobacteriota bacterium]|nr:hypothetical protein [Acidobacteriota bacterium]